MRFSIYKGWNFPFLLGDILNIPYERFDIEMLFIIIKESSLVSPPTLEAECW